MGAFAKLTRTAFLVWAVLIPSPPGGLAQQAGAPKRVLVMHWYDREYPANPLFDRYFQAALESHAPPGGIESYSEYLDTNKFPGEKQAKNIFFAFQNPALRHAVRFNPHKGCAAAYYNRPYRQCTGAERPCLTP